MAVWRCVLAALCAALAALALPPLAAAQRTVVVANAGTNDVASFGAAQAGGLTPVAGSPFDSGNEPTGVTFSPDARFAYVTTLNDDTVTRYSVGVGGALTELGATPTGGNLPTGLAFTPNGGRLLVTNRDPSGLAPRVSVFDVDSQSGALTPVAGSPFDVGVFDPTGVAVSPNGQFAYVIGRRGPDGPPPSNAESAIAVLRIGATGTLSPILGSPFYNASLNGGFGVAIAPDGTRLFVAYPGEDVIAVLNINQATAAPTPVAGSPFASVATTPINLEPTPDGSRLYSVHPFGQALEGWDVNPATGALTNIAGTPEPVGGQTNGIAITPDAESVYVSINDNPGMVRGYAFDGTGDVSAIPGATLSTGGDFPGFFSAAVTPTQSPEVSFTVDGPGTPGSPTAFDAAATTVRGGFATRYDWDFGDGTTAADAGPSPTHTYTDRAPHLVTLTVTNDCAPDAVFTDEVVSVGSVVVCNGPRQASTSRQADAGIRLEAKAAKRQRVGKLRAKLGCPEEACEASLDGVVVAKAKRKGRRAELAKRKRFELADRAVSLAAGETRTVKLKLVKGKRATKKLKRLLRKKPYRKGSRATLDAAASDPFGNEASAKLKVKKLRR